MSPSEVLPPGCELPAINAILNVVTLGIVTWQQVQLAKHRNGKRKTRHGDG